MSYGGCAVKLKQLHYFMALAEHINYKEAAHVLGVSQGLLNQQITALEEQLGTALFVRDGKGYRLTQSGYQLRIHASELFGMMTESIGSINQWIAENGTRRPLRLGYDRVIERSYLDRGINLFMHTATEYFCQCRSFGKSELLHELERGYISGAVGVFYSVDIPDGYITHLIDRVPVYLVCRRELLTSSLSALAEKFPLYYCDSISGHREFSVTACRSLGLSARPRPCQSWDELLLYLESGQGFAVLSKYRIDQSPLKHTFCLKHPAQCGQLEISFLCRATDWKAPLDSLVSCLKT